jgi:phosphoglycerate kinase
MKLLAVALASALSLAALVGKRGGADAFAFVSPGAARLPSLWTPSPLAPAALTLCRPPTSLRASANANAEAGKVAASTPDYSAMLRYFGGTVLQWGTLMAFLKAFEKLLLRRLPTRAASATVAMLFAFLALKSRVFSLLDNSRPKVSAEPEFKKPVWMPPNLVFPFVWLSIAVLRSISSCLVWKTTGTLITQPIAVMALHLSIGDTWNHVYNVKRQLGAGVVGVAAVWISAAATALLYYKTNPTAGLVLAPMVAWITIANILVNAIWRLNGRQPLYPPVESTPAPPDSETMSLSDLPAGDLSGKKVLVRCDLNVPLNGKEITDDTRIRASMATIKYLVDGGARVALSSHLGRPKGGPDDKYSLAPVAQRLTELLGKEVRMAPTCKGPEVQAMVSALQNGDVMLLENVRFFAEEEKNDPTFAKDLAAPFDLFVNDAFGTAHRAHASTEGVTNHVRRSVAGFLLQKELEYLQGAVMDPKRPFAAIVGGSKVSSKIGVIESLLEKVDKIIIGGGMVFTFLKARGLNVGSSLVEEDQLDLARKLEVIAKEKGVELILPSDVVIADKFASDAETQVVPVTAIPDGWMGLDNGPESTKLIQAALADCKTVIWNGPMGVFEMDAFAKGTFAVAETLASLTAKGCTTIIGGGDSVAAVEKAGLAEKMSHISTGGGASLELLEGKVLPGVAALTPRR